MGKVNILSKDITSKIAAGEVIERPASVIKELLENSIDAGSKDIEIVLENAGKKYIEITDSGSGIEPDDMNKIFNRHATSKIKEASDLDKITSLGFRGEALYSIGAISDITVNSKTKYQDSGWQIHLRGNKRLKFKPIGTNQGTRISVKELFFNTPARKKFLKSDSTELYHILKTLNPYLILHNEIRFKVTHQKRTLLNLPIEPSLKKRIAKVLKLNSDYILKKEKTISQKDLSVRLFLGDINIKRPRKDLQFMFVNNRPVQYFKLGFHINKAYESLFPNKVYPFFTVFIDIPAQDVDVNIHPTKREVKIKDEYTIATLLRTISKDLLSFGGSPKQIEDTHPFLKDRFSLNKSFRLNCKESQSQDSYNQFSFSSQAASFEDEESQITEETSQDKSLPYRLNQARYIGCFLKKYLFFETKESLLVIDQHACHERITYEYFLKQIESGHIETQHLLQPIIIPALSAEMLIWEEIKEFLEKAGFSTRLWDQEHIVLHTHPSLIKDPKMAITNLISSQEETSHFDKETIARKACRNSLKTGYTLSNQEALTLKKRLLECKNPFSCPHGRPTIIEMAETVFEKHFLRR